MAKPELWLHPTPEFFHHIYRLERELGPAAAPVLDALAETIKKLSSGDTPARMTSHGSSGHSFACRFHPEYLLTLDRKTERDERKKPVKIRLYLKTIERLPVRVEP